MRLSHPDLVTERLHLRLIQPADADFILQGLSDERVTQYYAVHYHTPEAVQEQMRFYENLLAQGTGAWWAFSLAGQQELIGACGLNSIAPEHRKGEIGFWLLPDYWGAGYVAEAARAVLGYAFEQMQLNRIEAIVEDGNIQSEKLLEKLGFSFEGRLRESEIKGGRYIDLLYYSILRREALPEQKAPVIQPA